MTQLLVCLFFLSYFPPAQIFFIHLSNEYFLNVYCVPRFWGYSSEQINNITALRELTSREGGRHRERTLMPGVMSAMKKTKGKGMRNNKLGCNFREGGQWQPRWLSG